MNRKLFITILFAVIAVGAVLLFIKSKTDAQSLVREVLPAVERTTGKKLKIVPQLKMCKMSELEPLLIANYSGNYDSNAAKNHAASFMKRNSKGLYGMFLPHTNVVVVIPDNVRADLDRPEGDKTCYEEALKLVVAHELAHALVIQEGGFSGGKPTAGNYQVSNGPSVMCEGFTNFVAYETALSIGAKKAWDALDRVALKKFDVAPMGPCEMFSKRQTQMARDAYLVPRSFFQWVYDSAGQEGLWRVVKNPPANTAMLYYPDTYSPVSDRDIDAKRVFKGIEALLPGTGWNSTYWPFDMIMTAAAIKATIPDDASKVIAGIVCDVSASAARGKSCVVVTIYDCRDKDAAASVAAFSREYMKKSYVLRKDVKGVKVDSPVILNLKDPRFSCIGKEIMGWKQGSYVRKEQHYEITRGNRVVVVNVNSVKITDDKVFSFADKVMKRAEKEVKH